MSKKVQKEGYKKTLCRKCTGLCCRYVALPIETPEDWDDYDDIRWYLYHENIEIFVEDGDWYINIKNKCMKLSETDYKCQIYDIRPRICRGYSDDNCDLTSDDDSSYEYELHFTNPDQMIEYMKIKFGPKVLEKLEKKKKNKKVKKADSKKK